MRVFAFVPKDLQFDFIVVNLAKFSIGQRFYKVMKGSKALLFVGLCVLVASVAISEAQKGETGQTKGQLGEPGYPYEGAQGPAPAETPRYEHYEQAYAPVPGGVSFAAYEKAYSPAPGEAAHP
ncbi:hypothetical protein WJX75_004670 [Coccomyxa subellipsoidea]|uniref:Uncharacterized protein n=1 Tax=Coccomyxa subellipsoidea TaxID=248742 RepID=A0ABR2Z1J8_9CHLO